MAKGEIVRFLAFDGIELQGFFVEGKKPSGILHIHGINGNFYENSFLDFIGNLAQKKGIKFLSMNTRGHDYVNELVKTSRHGFEIVNIGGALEIFEDCIQDIKAGIEFLKSKGCKKIILQGHSSGCQKIAYYQYKTNDRDVAGLVLSAPADDMTIVRNILGKDFEKVQKDIETAAKSGKYGKFMLQGTVGLPVISAGRLYSLSNSANIEARLFNFTGDMKEVASLSLPVLAVIGSKDIYLTMPAEKALKTLKSKMHKSSLCTTSVIEGSPHNFRGYEKQLVDTLIKWIDIVIE